MNQKVKSACNTSVDAALLAEAKALNISPSVVLEQALKKAVSQTKAELWREQNAEAIAAYNQQIAEQGTLAERLGQI
ncbi:type II toxin-antitoxin system CcdA family antitoxin [Rheinheimera aquimaris]|uniref:type II toxin-antitoxin system CcdA family antitoxin n=1 Tax=Rheinheimera aquimaris TaxID=412437 RepID=UPI001E3F0550|nr:type II toxin-antitoxin system CcdA family antitoxin [Rheinheimera aquimaris]MCD1597445.1 type II toxin-antitoxin system CcdA family antitoxin [Rheinheimera aquimaris]|tara:strand:+ start:321 stop:551 length:231 start_codon:yes stop_codon:yes gene_type:complete